MRKEALATLTVFGVAWLLLGFTSGASPAMFSFCFGMAGGMLSSALTIAVVPSVFLRNRSWVEPATILLLLFAAAECSAQQYHASPRTGGQYELGPGDGGPDEAVLTIGQPSERFGGRVVTEQVIAEYNAPSDYAVPVDGSEAYPLRAGLPAVRVGIDTPIVQLAQYRYPQQGYFYPRAPAPYVQPAPGYWCAVNRPLPVANWLFGPVYYWQPAPQQMPAPLPESGR